MPYIENLCINMPPEFPAVPFTQLRKLQQTVLVTDGVQSTQCKEFGLASNTIAWRYKAAHEELSLLRGHYSQKNAPVDHEDLYKREKAMFNFFTAGVSCIETTIYAIAAYTSKVLSFDFTEKLQRACSPSALNRWLKPYPTAEKLALETAELSNSAEWGFLLEVRNRLSHRGNLPAIVCASVGEAPREVNPLLFDRTTSTDPIDMNFEELSGHFDWITTTLASLLTTTLEV